MAINPGRGLLGMWGTKPLGPALDGILNELSRESKVKKDSLLPDFQKLIYPLRIHAIYSAIEVCKNPKTEYSAEQSLNELFSMWSELFWTDTFEKTMGRDLSKDSYYQSLEARIKEAVGFDVNHVVNGFHILKTREVGKLSDVLVQNLIELVYIIRTDAVNKLLQTVDQESSSKTPDQIVEKLLAEWNPERKSQDAN